MGDVTLQLDAQDLLIQEKLVASIKNEEQNLSGYCGKTYLVSDKVEVLKINIRKEDGSPFVEGDTPATDQDKMIDDHFICSDKSVGDWPC